MSRLFPSCRSWSTVDLAAFALYVAGAVVHGLYRPLYTDCCMYTKYNSKKIKKSVL